MQNSVIIVAAGRGKRYGGFKQFQIYRGHPLIHYALRAFEKSRLVHAIVLVVPKNRIVFARNYVKRSGFRKIRAVVPGGARRQDSVYSGFREVRGSEGCVIIHDGARPVIKPARIDEGIRQCQEYRAVIYGRPVTDTVKVVRKNKVVKTLERTGLFLIQTPQFFSETILRQAYERVNFKNDYTDEASLVEAAGFPVYLFEGDRDNIKITERADLRALTGRL
jgi:2-C-methyl-D-erythritol 4-phosphate cytidylyltransferase